MSAYYNEIDPYAAQWLRNLIAAGHIAAGEVDERSIVDVRPADLAGFTQCHFFAGIGVWSYALRLAGWPDTRPVWTASCPCQPFSAAGKRGGVEDERHLWPEVARLVRECGPGTLFGEQVASKDGLAWLDTVHADLEAEGYAVGALDTCAAGFGAPHIRQRLYFVAESTNERHERAGAARHWRDGLEDGGADSRTVEHAESEQVGLPRRARQPRGTARQLADADGRDASAEGLQRSGEHGQQPQDGGAGWLADHEARRRGEVDPIARRGDERVRAQGRERPDGGGESGVAHGTGKHAGLEGLPRHGDDGNGPGRQHADAIGSTPAAGATSGTVGYSKVGGRTRESLRANGEPQIGNSQATAGSWHPADWLACIDGKARPVEPGTFPLAHGIAGRVGRLRAYGNCIVAPQAAEFIRAYFS